MAVVIPAIDPRYVTTASLDEYFVDKDTGLPLANGTISFFQDANRLVPKNVFTLVDNPPGYNPPNYVALPNPITLSTVGTVSDNNGNNVPIYYFPYDAAGNLQLYYVVVADQFGTIQETRHAWPNVAAAENPATEGGTFSNALSNPQFVRALFLANNPLTITNAAGAGVVVYSLFPDWALSVNWAGNGTVIVARTSIAGSLAYPGNPPYTITITPGLNILTIQLIQTLNNNPDIFSPSVAGAANGWISAGLLLAPGSSIISMTYQPNGQVAQVILPAANNATGAYQFFTNTSQLAPATNPSTADTGFVNIIINLPAVAATTLSNVQIIGLQVNIPGIQWVEIPVNRQIDQLFNYYRPLLEYKPTTSYLVGWDFPLNPAQFLGTAVAAIASGANTSNYVWDQTILFQSANSGIRVSQGNDGTIILTSAQAAGSRFALIQYMDALTVNDILSTSLQGLSSNINMATIQGAGINCTISLYYTTGTLPNMAANASIVATLNADGSVATFNNGSQPWVQVARSNLGNATFTFSNNIRSNFGFSGWLDTSGGSNVATYFAIVVGFGNLAQNNYVTINSISLVPGFIPTIPAPETEDAVLMACSRFYTKSFKQGTVPVQNAGNEDAIFFPSTVVGGTGGICQQILLPTTMSRNPTFTFYNPQAANAFVWNYNTNASFTATGLQQAGNKSFAISFTSDAGCAVGNVLGFHYTADARLGF